MGYNLLINGVYWGYNLVTLTFYQLPGTSKQFFFEFVEKGCTLYENPFVNWFGGAHLVAISIFVGGLRFPASFSRRVNSCFDCSLNRWHR